jgi:hypothetical protein
MGTPAEPIPVSEETQALVQQSEPATLADVAGEAHPEEVQAEWYVVRQQGTKNFLAEVRNTNSQPYDTTAGFAAFGARTYFYESREEADEVVASGTGTEVVPIKISATLSYA